MLVGGQGTIKNLSGNWERDRRKRSQSWSVSEGGIYIYNPPNPLETVLHIVQILRPYAYSDLACAPCVLARYSSTFYGYGVRREIRKAPRIQNADNPS